ncbi:MAG TPA: alpha/beta fold hydrolase [Actinomycetota bacterium]
MSHPWDPIADETLRLPDGRTLAYMEWGDREGTPVLCFHGMPGSRLFFPDPPAAAELGVRAITIDRPGVGGSDPQPGHRIADGAADVELFADALGFDRFGVVGWSAGVPYALACAALIPRRLTGVAGTNSASAMIYLAPDDPQIAAAVIDDDDRRIQELLATDPDAGLREAIAVGADWAADLAEHPEQLLTEPDEGDGWFFEDPVREAMFVDSIREGVRQGIEGVALQWVAQLAPWGFRIEDVGIPFGLWAGASDRLTPPDRMRLLADRIPGARLTVWDDGGHLAIAKHLPEVLRDVLGER